jgi:3-carboxy-cis,cis-muconate cycloisomerase
MRGEPAEPGGLFDGVFARGPVDTGPGAWLAAMLTAEAALARALERAALAPPGAGAAVTAAAGAADIGLAHLSQQAARTGNPVPALARELARLVPADAAGAVHKGATSQDIIDTAAMLLARDALAAIAASLAAAAGSAARLAASHRGTVMIGRTLLQQAVPVTFGLVAAGWLTSLDEAADGLRRVRERRLAVQFGGAAGTLASLGADGPRVAVLLAEELGLAVPVLPWHTDRLRIVEIAAVCAGAAAALGKIARDVTLLAQTEIGEVREGAGEGGDGGGVRRGGSSAMPHKQNPVAAISVLACTRQVPALTAALTASAEAELQRAAGAWHAEWEPYSALLRLTGSAAAWGDELLSGLTVDAVRMSANLAATGGLPLAERVSALLAPAMGQAAAHDLVAEASAHAVSHRLPLAEAMLGLPGMPQRLAAAGVSRPQLDEALDPATYLGAASTFTDAALAAHHARFS